MILFVLLQFRCKKRGILVTILNHVRRHEDTYFSHDVRLNYFAISFSQDPKFYSDEMETQESLEQRL